MKLIRALFQIFLFILVLVLGIFVIFTGKREVKGRFLFVVKSGSMEPTIHTGSLIFVQKSQAYKTGDVVTFGSTARKDAIITHRIVDTKIASDAAYFVTKGDANNGPDPDLLPQSSVLGKYSFAIPLIGYPIAFAGTPLGAVILVIIPSTLILWEEARNLRKLLHRKHPSEPKE